MELRIVYTCVHIYVRMTECILNQPKINEAQMNIFCSWCLKYTLSIAGASGKNYVQPNLFFHNVNDDTFTKHCMLQNTIPVCFLLKAQTAVAQITAVAYIPPIAGIAYEECLLLKCLWHALLLMYVCTYNPYEAVTCTMYVGSQCLKVAHEYCYKCIEQV